MTTTAEDLVKEPRKLLQALASGEDVILVQDGKPIARVVPIRAGERPLGIARGQIKIAEDSELPADLVEEFYK